MGRQISYNHLWLQNTEKHCNSKALALNGTGYRESTFASFSEEMSLPQEVQDFSLVLIQ